MARILIVDDEALNLEVAAVICGAAGHAVTTARDGLEALACLEGATFDLILLDVLMPRLDGIALTQKLRADSRFVDLPIVGMTAKAVPVDIQEMLAAGMQPCRPSRSRTRRCSRWSSKRSPFNR